MVKSTNEWITTAWENEYTKEQTSQKNGRTNSKRSKPSTQFRSWNG